MDYEKLGFKAGIEIHAQLEGKKLFCDCPTCIRDPNLEEDNPDYVVQRKLKAVVGEIGEIDAAAAKEQDKNKVYEYQGYDDTTCLVELDEEPPHLMNKGALNLALQMCLRFNTKIVDEIQVMRKTVVDGSNTSGFQRTSLLGMNGSLEVNQKNIGIQTVCLEEDACKIVSRSGDKDMYNLSRLGVPLIEIATDPDMKTAEEVADVAKEIGMLLRSLKPFNGQSIKRGLGTIRQDVNVSITGGNRIEIKGAQDLKMIPTLVDNEISRQQVLIDLQKAFSKLSLQSKQVDITDIFKNTACTFVKKTIDDKGVVYAIKLEGLAGVIGKETMPGRRIGSEISDYAKQASGVGGLIHSDEKLDKYKFTKKEIDAIKKVLSCTDNDAFLIVADKKNKATTALTAALERINRIPEGVIKEVRKANADGTTSYMRPMPGGARMYPETDTLPVVPDMSTVKLGRTIAEYAKHLQESGVKDADIAKQIASEYRQIYEELQVQTGTDPQTLATQIISGSSVIEPSVVVYGEIFIAMNEGIIPKNAFLEVLELIKKGKSVQVAIASKESLPKEQTEKIIDKVLLELGDVDKSKMGLIMGKVMAASKGKADGKLVSEILRSKL